MKRLLAAALLAAVICAAPAATAAPSLKGRYTGTVMDPEGDPDSYAVSIRITTSSLKAKRRAGTIAYKAAADEELGMSALNCRGFLSYRGRRGKAYEFFEQIRFNGTDRDCLKNGRVLLTRTSTGFKYKWTKRGYDRERPTGTLKRR